LDEKLGRAVISARESVPVRFRRANGPHWALTDSNPLRFQRSQVVPAEVPPDHCVAPRKLDLAPPYSWVPDFIFLYLIFLPLQVLERSI
jgi:hypothetical protein